MAKVLLISPNFYPEKTGIGVTATDCAIFLKDLGHQVEVLTSVPYYPEWKIHSEYRGKVFVEETHQEIPLTRVWLYVPEKVTTFGRILQEISFAFLLAFKLLFRRCDRIVCITPPLSAAAVIAVVSFIKRKPFWIYIKDIQPDAAICLGMLTNPLMIKISRFLERFGYLMAEKILLLSEGMRRNLLKKGVAEEKLEIVPDSIDVDELYLPDFSPETSLFRIDRGLSSVFLAVYSGNIGVKQNPEIIVEAAKHLRDEADIFFAVVGEGAMRPRLEELIEEYQLENIKIYPLCDREYLADMLASADVLLMPQRESVLDIVVPSKLLSYLTSGTPVLASVHADSEAAKVLRAAEAGLVVDAEQVELFADGIRQLRDNPEEAKSLGLNGLKLIQDNYSHEVVKEKHYKPLFAQ